MPSLRARLLLAVSLLAVLFVAAVATAQVGQLRVGDEVGAPGAPVDDGVVEESSAPQGPPPQVPAPAQRATVERIVDGDTVRVRVEEPGTIGASDAVVVRLVTIDTPETVHPQRGVECGGPEASARTRELLPVGATVWLVADTSDTDRFDRHLRAIWTDDGTFVNARLVAEGLAEAVRYPPDDRFYDQLAALQTAARAAGRGNWARCPA